MIDELVRAEKSGREGILDCRCPCCGQLNPVIEPHGEAVLIYVTCFWCHKPFTAVYSYGQTEPAGEPMKPVTLTCPTCHRDFVVDDEMAGLDADDAQPGELPQQLRDTYEADIENKLRGLFPHGHQAFIGMCMEEMKLHSDKNHDYAGENPMGNFDRVGTILSLYPELELDDPVVVAMVYMLKQLDAALRLKADKVEAMVEAFDSRMADVAVYAKLCRIMEAR